MPAAVHVQLQLRIVGDDGTVFTDDEILRLEKSAERLEALGLSLSEAKTLQERLQQQLVTAQAAACVERHCGCATCGRRLASKGQYPIVFRTAFGTVALSSPRFHRCGCRPADTKTFSPLAALFTEHTAPELLYLQTRWASLISFGLTVALLKDVLPIAGTTNPETQTCTRWPPVRTPISAAGNRASWKTIPSLTHRRRSPGRQSSSGLTAAISGTGTTSGRSSR
jgi:hypothetical protein